MIEQLRDDVVDAPGAFHLSGPVSDPALDQVAPALGHSVPEALRGLWCVLGGGELFETEEVLAPVLEGVDSVVVQNRQLRRAGLPADLLVFHRGLSFTAVDRSRGYVALHWDTLRVIGSFDSLDACYADLRREYAERYGLNPELGKSPRSCAARV